jgi:hypothetical protein
VKIKLTLLSFIILLSSGKLLAQDSSLRQSPSGLTVAEGRLSSVKLKTDFIDDDVIREKASYAGIGATFSSNLFRRANEAMRFRHADFEGATAAIGLGGKGLWFQAKIDLGWQFHYALGKKVDAGIRVFGTAITDKIPFIGVLATPSLKLGSLYFDYTNGVNIALGNDLKRTYQEFNMRFLFPNDESYDMDRWYLGIKVVTFSGINTNTSRTTTKMNQGSVTVGLML